MSRAVVEVFVRLHEEGLIYRGKRLVNWDPALGTAVSDLEVESEEENGKIWEIRYPGDGFSLDGRHDPAGNHARRRRRRGESEGRTLRGTWSASRSTLPLTGRKIPVIADDYVDPRIRHRLRQDHAGARLQRLRSRRSGTSCR